MKGWNIKNIESVAFFHTGTLENRLEWLRLDLRMREAANRPEPELQALRDEIVRRSSQ